MQQYVEQLQERICTALERLDGQATFRRDPWERTEGGGGLTRVIADGAVFEKGGVNTSAVHGRLPERMAQAFDVDPMPFFATGLSLVLHPRSPMVPTVHANVRYFALGDDLATPEDQWFGGGADLTPYYPTLGDTQHFHRSWRAVCDDHDAVADYAAFKKHCDDYFYVAHREEARGVGGIFYDYLRDDAEVAFAFSKAVGDAFLEAYVPIVERRRDAPFGEEERIFQAVRRGRYVEFNLVYDRGTRFGLETRGRTESILMSLPPKVEWHYAWVPTPDSREAQAMWFFQPRDWLDLTPADVPK
jgi:coproporphyrinogen III oxidase